jgi:hypothetical protein
MGKVRDVKEIVNIVERKINGEWEIVEDKVHSFFSLWHYCTVEYPYPELVAVSNDLYLNKCGHCNVVIPDNVRIIYKLLEI